MPRLLERPDNDPRRGACPYCGADVLRVTAHGRLVLVDWPEVVPHEERGYEPGLYVAVDHAGEAHAVRMPGVLVAGQALYRPHEASCRNNPRGADARRTA